MIAWRFALVGIFATLLHLSVALLLISYLGVHAALANFLAFVASVGISFCGNYYWTFRCIESGPAVRRALLQFLLVSASACVLNISALLALVTLVRIDEQLAVMLSALVVPAYTFVMSRFWAFR